jgi:hypothetical protein
LISNTLSLDIFEVDGIIRVSKRRCKLKKSTILEKLCSSESGAVVPEEIQKFSSTRVRLWTLASDFKNQADLRELGRIFPNMAKEGELIRLGEHTSLNLANQFLARARERAVSPAIGKLFLLPTKRAASPKPKPFGIRRESKRRVITV